MIAIINRVDRQGMPRCVGADTIILGTTWRSIRSIGHDGRDDVVSRERRLCRGSSTFTVGELAALYGDTQLSALAFTFAASTTRIIRDGIARDPQALRADAESLAERLRHARPGRVALFSSRADVVTVALCACEQADVELLLLRRMPSTDAALAELAAGADP
jgi:hypothetical protein